MTAFRGDINCDTIDLISVDESIKALDAELLRILNKHKPLGANAAEQNMVTM